MEFESNVRWMEPRYATILQPAEAGFVCVDAVSTAGVCGLMGDINSCEIGIIHLFLCVKSGLIIPIQPELISFQHI